MPLSVMKETGKIILSKGLAEGFGQSLSLVLQSYASFRYEGNWENYPDWVRNIYLIELPARGLARVNGSDIERFYYNEDFVEKDGNDVVCEIFIPVRPV